MTAINIRLPESIARKANELAAQDGVTLDQFVSVAVAEKVSAWITEGYLDHRASRASREKFESALRQVPDVPPEDDDRL